MKTTRTVVLPAPKLKKKNYNFYNFFFFKYLYSHIYEFSSLDKKVASRYLPLQKVSNINGA